MGIAHCAESLKTINGHICVFRPGGNSTENRKTEKLKNRKTEKPKNRKTEKPSFFEFLNMNSIGCLEYTTGLHEYPMSLRTNHTC
jgi:hypothetical protein